MKALDLANYIVWYANKYYQNTSFTHVKLQKILYYVYCDFLKQGTQLFNDEIQKWQYGPVTPSVYNHFRSNGFSRISTPETEVKFINDDKGIRFEREPFNPESLELDADQVLKLNEIIKSLITKEAFELVEKTHQESSWLRDENLINAGQKSISYTLQELKNESFTIEQLIS